MMVTTEYKGSRVVANP
jgi:hypothetical protein